MLGGLWTDKQTQLKDKFIGLNYGGGGCGVLCARKAVIK